ncbi:MAG: GNAT family N-acetyltransferase [Marinilabiliaceae bacterium]|nr:GNAT family N-acetyltransferase [Marinilabiliaceae bacterium]
MYFNGKTSARLNYRQLALSDIAKWQHFFEDEASLEYLGLDLSLDKAQQARDWIGRQLWRYENQAYGHHALIEKETGCFIGQCGLLTQEVEGRQELEIGYHLFKEYRGQGYATEAALAFRDYAFENTQAPSLISIIDVRNSASQKVAQKMGMVKTEQVRYYSLDVYIYRIQRESWFCQKEGK